MSSKSSFLKAKNHCFSLLTLLRKKHLQALKKSLAKYLIVWKCIKFINTNCFSSEVLFWRTVLEKGSFQNKLIVEAWLNRRIRPLFTISSIFHEVCLNSKRLYIFYGVFGNAEKHFPRKEIQLFHVLIGKIIEKQVA